MSIFFPLWYAPDVPPELGATTQIEGTLKKFRRFAPEFVPLPRTSKPCRCLCMQSAVISGHYGEHVQAGLLIAGAFWGLNPHRLWLYPPNICPRVHQGGQFQPPRRHLPYI